MLPSVVVMGCVSARLSRDGNGTETARSRMVGNGARRPCGAVPITPGPGISTVMGRPTSQQLQGQLYTSTSGTVTDSPLPPRQSCLHGAVPITPGRGISTAMGRPTSQQLMDQICTSTSGTVTDSPLPPRQLFLRGAAQIIRGPGISTAMGRPTLRRRPGLLYTYTRAPLLGCSLIVSRPLLTVSAPKPPSPTNP